MPRNPATKKNQHNNRHENGLVGPGKRVTKQKSNGHLNGNVKPVLPDEPVPVSSGIDSQPSPSHTPSTAYGVPANPKLSLTKQNSESSFDGNEQKWENANGSASTSIRRPDMAQVKNRSTHDINAIHVVATILRSCPAGDTVSLLIVLLALPSMVLTVVQALFASLTLMPPTNISPVSFLSLFDVFQGSAGSPSLGTMAVVDIICFGLWIALWTWAQNFALDLAQIQIAMTLGNGNSSKSGSVNLFCFVIVLILHSIRSSGVRQFFKSRLMPESVLSYPNLQQFAQYLPSEADFGEDSRPPSKISSLFAIHILSQALMAFVRRRVTSTQAASSAKPRRGDADTVTGPASTSEPTDVDLTKASTTGVDYQAPPTPGSKDSKDRLSSAKKRRRQANQVRSRQPFWAALASTKVHVLREVEHNAGPPKPGCELQTSSSPESQDVVWITNVKAATIEFEATLLSNTESDPEAGASFMISPFFVRINEARWHSVSIEPLNVGHRLGWRGTISGLAPDCTYTCSFIRDEDEKFASIMVKTPAIRDGEYLPTLASLPPRAPLRPHSPTTTLKNSIQTGEAKLVEVRARLTKSRRSHKNGTSRIEREVESLQSRLKSSSDDNRQKQKLLQAERSIQQTEAATETIATALTDLEAIPEEDIADYDSKKVAFEDKSAALAHANEALVAARAEAKNELGCINNELNQITSRKERLQARQGKLTEQHDRITQANAQGINEKERKAQEAARIEADRQRREAELSEGINHMAQELRDVQNRTQSHWREIDAIERQAMALRDSMFKNGVPLTPEGNLPGTNPSQNRPAVLGGYQPSSFAGADFQASPFLAYAKTLPPDTRRSRSDTNQSIGAMSSFSADAFEDADPIPPMPSESESIPVNGRKGSGSSHGKNNGSPAGMIGESLRHLGSESDSPGNRHGVSTW